MRGILRNGSAAVSSDGGGSSSDDDSDGEGEPEDGEGDEDDNDGLGHAERSRVRPRRIGRHSAGETSAERARASAAVAAAAAGVAAADARAGASSGRAADPLHHRAPSWPDQQQPGRHRQQQSRPPPGPSPTPPHPMVLAHRRALSDARRAGRGNSLVREVGDGGGDSNTLHGSGGVVYPAAGGAVEGAADVTSLRHGQFVGADGPLLTLLLVPPPPPPLSFVSDAVTLVPTPTGSSTAKSSSSGAEMITAAADAAGGGAHFSLSAVAPPGGWLGARDLTFRLPLLTQPPPLPTPTHARRGGAPPAQPRLPLPAANSTAAPAVHISATGGPPTVGPPHAVTPASPPAGGGVPLLVHVINNGATAPAAAVDADVDVVTHAGLGVAEATVGCCLPSHHGPVTALVLQLPTVVRGAMLSLWRRQCGGGGGEGEPWASKHVPRTSPRLAAVRTDPALPHLLLPPV